MEKIVKALANNQMTLLENQIKMEKELNKISEYVLETGNRSIDEKKITIEVLRQHQSSIERLEAAVNAINEATHSVKEEE